jgi:hypothetical protein
MTVLSGPKSDFARYACDASENALIRADRRPYLLFRECSSDANVVPPFCKRSVDATQATLPRHTACNDSTYRLGSCGSCIAPTVVWVHGPEVTYGCNSNITASCGTATDFVTRFATSR